jgi:thioredoxin reductase
VNAARAPVVVVGGGPAGLACAIELRRLGVSEVLVLEREPRAGGIPRHCHHQGFGMRDLRRLLSGPAYARRYVELARRSGCRVEEEVMVTGWAPSGALEVTSPAGRRLVDASAVVLATGCRERPRAARLVPGSRPAGVMTTGMLQQLGGEDVEELRGRALIVGAEHVSFSALLTLRHAGARVAAMVTELDRHQSLPLASAAARARFGMPLWTRTALRAIHGRERVEGVVLEHLESGATTSLACETVIFSADWIPDHELAVMGGLELDPLTRGPRVDTALRTSRAGVFAAGNLVHGAEPADVAALGGRHAAHALAHWLGGADEWPRVVPIACRGALGWISPNAVAVRAQAPPRGRFALRASVFLRRPALEISQGGRVLWRGRTTRLGPGRSAALPAAWMSAVDPAGGHIELALQSAGRKP